MRIKQRLVNTMLYDFIPFLGWINVRKNKFCNVIYFHDIVEGEGYSLMKMPIDKFKRMMNYIVDNGYKPLRFDDLDKEENMKFNRKSIIIGFDDGWLSNYTEIFDFMKSKNIKYNIYLTVGEIGNNPEYLNWEQVREMHASGIVGFGAHTYTHPDMSDLAKINWDVEIEKTNAVFKEQLGYEPLDFCYPFGYYSEQSNLELEKRTNYKRLYTSDNMYSYEQNGVIVMGRNGIGDQYPFKYFKRQLKGFLNISKNYWHVYSIIRGK